MAAACRRAWPSSPLAHISPIPRRGKKGNDILGPQNPERQKQGRDTIRPPDTDAGKMPNMKWSFADSHMRLEEGGWARETTVRELPTSKELAGVNMRLGPGVYRELHWHNENEWAYIIAVGPHVVPTREELTAGRVPHHGARHRGRELHRRCQEGRPVVLPLRLPARHSRYSHTHQP